MYARRVCCMAVCYTMNMTGHSHDRAGAEITNKILSSR